MTPKGLVDGPDPQEAHIVGHTLMVGIWEHGFWVVPIGVYHALKVFFCALFFAVGVTSGHLCWCIRLAFRCVSYTFAHRM